MAEKKFWGSFDSGYSPSLRMTGVVGEQSFKNPAVIAGAHLHPLYFLPMYEDFKVRDRWTGEEIRCVYQALIVAIATRHADAVDIKFLANGKPIWIALPHPAWVEYQRRTGKVITDPLAIQIAGHFLKNAVESGADSSREMYTLTVEETLRHLDGVLEPRAA
jgi:hypothetical protein